VPSETFAYTALANVAPQQVWEALQRVETWAGLGGGGNVFDPTLDEHGLAGYRFTAEVGGRPYQGRARRLSVRTVEAMTMEIETSDLKGILDIRVEPWDSGSRLIVELAAHSKGFRASLLFPIIAAAIGGGLPRNVDAFVDSLT
jgi:hypothetical protein